MFELQGNIVEMTVQDILIHLQNIIESFKFVIGYPGFRQN